MTGSRRQFIKASPAAGGVFAGDLASQLDAAQSKVAIPMPTERAKALMALFRLKYPIFEAPHGPRATGPDLAGAVSNAGAMGALALSNFTPDRARDAVVKVRAATKGNFVVNYILAFSQGKEPLSLKSALDAGAPIVQFSWGMPTKDTVSVVRSAGAKMAMQVTSVESARAALDLGADYLVCQGTEAGGHVQASNGLFETLPFVLGEAKQKPVIASGGIGNGQGIRKALLAGAWGAMLGTRFVATLESPAHPDFKQAILKARAKDTALTICFQDGWPAMHRAIRNRTFVLWEAAGCPSPGTRPGEGDAVATAPDGTKFLRYSANSPGQDLKGSPVECALYAGTSVEFVKDVPPAREVVQRLWRECETAR